MNEIKYEIKDKINMAGDEIIDLIGVKYKFTKSEAIILLKSLLNSLELMISTENLYYEN